MMICWVGVAMAVAHFAEQCRQRIHWYRSVESLWLETCHIVYQCGCDGEAKVHSCVGVFCLVPDLSMSSVAHSTVFFL